MVDVERASDELRGSLTGAGSVFAALTADVGVLGRGAVEGAESGVAQAEANLRAAIAVAAEAGGSAEAMGAAMADAFADFHAQAEFATAALVALDGIGEGDNTLAAELLVAVSGSLFGEISAD